MAVVYSNENRFGPLKPYTVRSYCLECGKVIISVAFRDYCLYCSLKVRESARDDGELSQNPCE